MYFEGLPGKIYIKDEFLSLKIGFILANSADPDEKLPYLGFHWLPKYVFTGVEVIKLFLYSIQQNRKVILLINVKMPTIVGILTFISMINTTSERLRARNFFYFRYFSFYEQLKFPAQLS